MGPRHRVQAAMKTVSSIRIAIHEFVRNVISNDGVAVDVDVNERNGGDGRQHNEQMAAPRSFRCCSQRQDKEYQDGAHVDVHVLELRRRPEIVLRLSPWITARAVDPAGGTGRYMSGASVLTRSPSQSRSVVCVGTPAMGPTIVLSGSGAEIARRGIPMLDRVSVCTSNDCSINFLAEMKNAMTREKSFTRASMTRRQALAAASSLVIGSSLGGFRPALAQAAPLRWGSAALARCIYRGARVDRGAA